jgi:aspartyl-tRNA(Asn)/glutamyl-tRNA(Gln) amidotransferase subunit A
MLSSLGVADVANGIATRQFSAEEYISQILERIEKVEPKINALITVNPAAIDEARAIDRTIRDGGSAGALCGVAVSIKDNICTKGLKTTCSSKMLEDFFPPYDSTAVKRLRKAGAIIIGKANLDEFAMGSTTEFSSHGTTRNPWDIGRVPGGSSGGSAASVASQECAASLGSDTGGSVRCPASFCAVVGMKPTYGLVSRFGLVSYANSLEQIGPIGRSVRDVILVLNTIAGNDPNDLTTLPNDAAHPPYTLEASGKRLRIGLVKEFIQGAEPAVSKVIHSATDSLSSLGHKVGQASLPSAGLSLASYYTIAMAEASSNLARYDNIRYGYDLNPEGYEWNTYFTKSRGAFGDEAKRRIITGSYILSSGFYGKYYMKAQQVRSLLREELKSLYQSFDVLVGPTMPILPFKIGEKIDDPLKMYVIDIDTVVANLAGIPAITVPAGLVNGLPVGLQIMADYCCEQVMFEAALSFEAVAGFSGSPDL